MLLLEMSPDIVIRIKIDVILPTPSRTFPAGPDVPMTISNSRRIWSLDHLGKAKAETFYNVSDVVILFVFSLSCGPPKGDGVGLRRRRVARIVRHVQGICRVR